METCSVYEELVFIKGNGSTAEELDDGLHRSSHTLRSARRHQIGNIPKNTLARDRPQRGGPEQLDGSIEASKEAAILLLACFMIFGQENIRASPAC